MLGRMRRLLTTPAVRALTALLLAGLVGGCSDDGCSGVNYHPDLSQAGEPTPIDALDTWLAGDTQLPVAPTEGWTQEAVEPDDVATTISNDDGDGWRVIVARTESGGWAVEQATAEADKCE